MGRYEMTADHRRYQCDQRNAFGTQVTVIEMLDRLLPVEAELWRMGGSIAQRDLIEWTLTEAAIRSGQRNIALSLANERLALRPDSVVNRQFQEQAETLSAA